MLDDIFSLADVNMGFDPHMSGSTAEANLIWMGMDPDISDSEIDQLAVPSEDDSSSLDQDSESDTDDDANIPKLHPAMMSLSKNDDIDNITSEREPDAADLDEEEVFAGSATDLPEVVKRLQEKLLAGYTSSNHPPINDSRGRSLTPSEMLSLKHYVAWVDSRGTVKAYSLHAKVLKEASNTEILTLYSVRKLAIELTGLSIQLVDMCPKSCMAFTGEFKDLHSCIHIRDKRRGPCGQPRYDKKGFPRAQMLYTPIASVIQSFYGNKEMAKAMRYQHEHLQMALKKLKPNSSPTEYSDFSDSINHINHYQEKHLFQNETDTAITISGDGAQLTMKKQSDVWVLIVTILNLPPSMRSRAANIIIPLVIPGPSSPGNVESFIYVLYEELAKLSVGVWTWDALSERSFLLKIFLCGVLGDMLGSAKLSRMAGHMALYGCRFSMVRGARSSKDKGMIQYYTFETFYLILPYRCKSSVLSPLPTSKGEY